jgi:hypothetical protein
MTCRFDVSSLLAPDHTGGSDALSVQAILWSLPRGIARSSCRHGFGGWHREGRSPLLDPVKEEFLL